MAKHEKEKNLLGELLLETKTRGGGLQLIGWRFCDGPPLFLSLSFLCVLLFLLFFFLSLYHPFWPNLVFFYLYVFFSLVGWINAMRESRSSIAGVLKESQKCLWFPPSLYVFCSSSSVSRDPPWLVVFLWLLQGERMPWLFFLSSQDNDPGNGDKHGLFIRV